MDDAKTDVLMDSRENFIAYLEINYLEREPGEFSNDADVVAERDCARRLRDLAREGDYPANVQNLGHRYGMAEHDMRLMYFITTGAVAAG